MSDKRHNVFNHIHKGLRGFLFDTALTIQRTDFSKPEAQQTLTQVKEGLQFFEQHAAHEDVFVLTHVHKYSPHLVDDLKKDHKINLKLSEELFSLAKEWKKSLDADKRENMGKKIFYAFNEFIAFNLYHMNREENELMYVLWKHYTDAELIRMDREIVQSIKPATLFAESRWMIGSINNSELVGWLTRLKNTAPEKDFNAYLAMAEEELSKIRWTAIQAEINQAVLA